MFNKISPRLLLAATGFVCLGLLGMAWYLQYGPGKQQPCPLCILQRYAYLCIAVVSLLGAVHGPRGKGILAYFLAADLLASVGMGLAAWQVTKGSSMTTCLADPIGEFVNGLPTANWLPEYFYANGGCADVFPPILGIVVPVWSLIWFSVLFVLIALGLFSALRSTRVR